MGDLQEYCLDLGRRAKRAATELSIVTERKRRTGSAARPDSSSPGRRP